MHKIIIYKPNESKYTAGLITEYDPVFPSLYLQYARNYMNPEGFWGEYKIDSNKKKQWMNQYPEFQAAILNSESITTNSINQAFSKLLTVAYDANDIKTITQLLLKMVDLQYKTDKDTGSLREKAQQLRESKKTNDDDISDRDVDTMDSYFNKD